MVGLERGGLREKVGVWGFIGVVPLAMGLLRFCPLYKITGFNSCQLAKREEAD
uniref:YgaP family membrane protein n=1 Tax=Iodobacter sp. CM08 TaxID=3085902 RepID=UPI0039905300